MSRLGRIDRAVFLLVVFFATARISAGQVDRLRVSENHRYLGYPNGKPFFYLGDTAWALFHRLNREEATRYLTNRALLVVGDRLISTQDPDDRFVFVAGTEEASVLPRIGGSKDGLAG